MQQLQQQPSPAIAATPAVLSSRATLTLRHLCAVASQHRRHNDALSTLVQDHFDGDALAASNFLLALLGSRALVVLEYHRAFVEWWRDLLDRHHVRIMPHGDPTIGVYYAASFSTSSGLPVRGWVRYMLEPLVAAVCELVCTRVPPLQRRFASVFDVPQFIVCAMLGEYASERMRRAVTHEWVENTSYDYSLLTTTMPRAWSQQQQQQQPTMAAYRGPLQQQSSENSILRDFPELLDLLYCEDAVLASANDGAVTSSGNVEFHRLLSVRDQHTPAGEWFARTMRSSSRDLVMCARVLYELEAHRVWSSSPSQQQHGSTESGLWQYLSFFPLCMAMVRNEQLPYLDALLERLDGSCRAEIELAQHVADAVRLFLVDPSGRTLPSACSDQLRRMVTALRNIRMCVAPLLTRMRQLDDVTHQLVTAQSHTRDARFQRMHYRAVEATDVHTLAYSVLLEQLYNVGEFQSVVNWVRVYAARALPVPQDPASVELLASDPMCGRARAIVHALARQYTALCFFPVNTSQAPQHRATADFFAVLCTFQVLRARHPDLALDNEAALMVGHCEYGPYAIMHNDVLWMVRHAMASLALCAERRCYSKTTPFYTEMLRIYYGRYHDEVFAHQWHALDDKRLALFLPSSARASSFVRPSAVNPNVFAHAMFVQVLGSWLCVPVGVSGADTSVSAEWGVGVPDPSSPLFGATHFMHRLVDQLHRGGEAMLRAHPQHAQRSAQFYVDDDIDSLNAVRAFLQLCVPHSLSYAMLLALRERLTIDATLRHEFADLLALIAALLPLADEAMCAYDAGHYDYCQRKTVEFGASLSATTALPPPPPSPPVKANSDALPTFTRKRTAAAAASASAANGRDDYSKLQRRADSAEQSATRFGVADTLDRTLDDYETRRRDAVRVPLLPTSEVLERLDAKHPLRQSTDVSLATSSNGAASTHDVRQTRHALVGGVNLLFYLPALCNVLDPAFAKLLLCDLRVGGSQLTFNELFGAPRYSGSINDTMRNFVLVKTHWESMVLNSNDDDSDDTRRQQQQRTRDLTNDVSAAVLHQHDKRVLVYHQGEPYSELARLLRHLDLRVTRGDTRSGATINSVMDEFSETVPTAHLLSSVDDDDDERTAKTVLPQMRAAEMPVHIEQSEVLYVGTSLLVVSTVGHEERLGALKPWTRRCLEVVQRTADAYDYAALGSHLAAQYAMTMSAANPRVLYTHGEWLRNTRGRIQHTRDQEALKEHVERSYVPCDLDSFMKALDAY